MNRFKCGLCYKGPQYCGTRHGLREHLRVEHRIVREISNTKMDSNKQDKKHWWIVEEC